MRGRLLERYFLLFFPWLLSEGFSYIPVVSFCIAWLGSFYIFYLTYSERIKELPKDLPIAEQLMRPVFLIHVIFAGYMSVSPIFNFIDALGWVSLDNDPFPAPQRQFELIVESQRYYCLGHASYVMGLLAFLREPRVKNKLEVTDFPSFLVRFTIIVLMLSNAMLFVPALRQYYFQLSSVSFIAGTMGLIFSARSGRIEYIIICSILYIINFMQALLSGFKEPVIINVLILAIFLFPFYKKLVLVGFTPVMLILFLLLPRYNQVFREKAWANQEDVESASDAALAAITSEDDEERENTTWSFLTGRLSEVQMFTGYLESTPSINDYYGFEILSQSIEVIIPRAFWPNKPVTEELVMERVYRSGVISRGSKVSAKPALVVDGYLSGGSLGVFLTCLVFAIVTQVISVKAEEWFGGYLIGTALIFSGLFQILWRGLSFEFLINSVIWSFVTMYIIYAILRVLNVLKKVDEGHSS